MKEKINDERDDDIMAVFLVLPLRRMRSTATPAVEIHDDVHVDDGLLVGVVMIRRVCVRYLDWLDEDECFAFVLVNH
jgi:hypothetical protein